MSELDDRLLERIAAGDKIGAIRVLREATGVGLAEAKAAVEHLERTGSMPAKPKPAPADVPVELADLARQGKTVEAIKILRERRELSLADAKRIVDGLPVDPGARRSGCLGVVIGAVGLAAALLGG